MAYLTNTFKKLMTVLGVGTPSSGQLGEMNQGTVILDLDGRLMTKDAQNNLRLISEVNSQYNHTNLWIDGAMRMWQNGNSGQISGGYNNGLIIFRGIGNTGGTATWEKEISLNRTWLKIIHTDATDYGYFSQRQDVNTLNWVKGKTVVLSFDYIFSKNMNADVIFFYKENGSITNSKTINVSYQGDNSVHRMQVIVDLPSNNIIPDNNSYFGVQIGYGDNSLYSETMKFSNIQLEVNDKQTKFQYEDITATRRRVEYYYKVQDSFVIGHRIASVSTRIGVAENFNTPMRVSPAISIDWLALYNNSAVNIGVSSVAGTKKTHLGSFIQTSEALNDSAYIYKYTADARIY